MGASGMSIAYGADSVASLGQGIGQSMAVKARGDYEEFIARQNADLAERDAKEITKRGDKASSDYKNQVNQLKGQQRSSMAAQGIDINQGSAAEIQKETATLGALDALQLKNNAWREAFGMRGQANQYRAQARMTGISARNEARNTLLTGGMQALSSGAKAAYYLPSGKAKAKDE
jgi:hypothetical protein